ncbi:MAG: hypothetical protein ACUVQ8_02215 [Nitrososphaeria archaeon]
MDSQSIDVVIEPYRKIVVHELIEYVLEDWIDMILAGIRSVGGTMPTLFWCNGVVFQTSPFNPNSESIIKEQLKGIVHYSAVTFALKEKFESEIRSDKGTILLIDVSANPNFAKLAQKLKANSRLQVKSRNGSDL